MGGFKLVRQGGGNKSKGELTEGKLENRASKMKRKSRQGVVADPSTAGGLKCICFNARSITG